jgi:hypothetical protein
MIFRSLIKPVLAFMVLLAAMMQPAFAQSSGGSNVQQEIINGVVQNIIQSVRDQLQRRRVVPPPGMSRFSGEESDFSNKDPFAAKGVSNPFSALAYAKAPLLASPAPSVWLYGANLIGSGDRSTTFGTETRVETVTGAFDVTKIGVFTTTDALTFIGTGSHSWSRAEASFPVGPSFITDGSIPSTSGTVSYLNGGFSADFTALASWTRNTVNTPLFVAPDSSSVAYTGNAQYRFDFPYSVWIEPTAGVTYTEVYTANFGTKLADTTEVHGGARIGTEMKWMGYTVQPTLSGSVFKVVDANVALGPFVGPIPAAAVAAGTLGGRGSAKVTVLWTSNFSSYLEFHGSGTANSSLPPPGFNPPSTSTIGAQAGLRYTWN